MKGTPSAEVGWWYDAHQLPQLRDWLATWLPAADWVSEVLGAYFTKGFLEAPEWQRLKQGAGGWERFRTLARRASEHARDLPPAAAVWVRAQVFVVEAVQDVSSLRLTKGLEQLFTIGLTRSLVLALIPERSAPDPDAPLRKALSEVLAFQRLPEADFAALSAEQIRRLANVLTEAEPLAMAVVPPARRSRHQRLQAVLAQALSGPRPTAARLNAALDRLDRRPAR